MRQNYSTCGGAILLAPIEERGRESRVEVSYMLDRQGEVAEHWSLHAPTSS